MWDIVINGMVSVLSITGGVLVMRSKYRAEVDKLRAEVEQLQTSTRDSEIKLIANASQTLLTNVVNPLENELTKVRKVVEGLEKALQKVWDCPFVGDCPVRKQLHRSKKGDGICEQPGTN